MHTKIVKLGFWMALAEFAGVGEASGAAIVVIHQEKRTAFQTRASDFRE